MKVQDAPKKLKQTFDVVVCNPPYNSKESSKQNVCREIAIARHELFMNLEDMVIAASKLLKYGGKFYFIHRADRLDEIFEHLIKYKLRPKVLQVVSPKTCKPPHLVMIECIKDGRPGIKVLPQMYIGEGVLCDPHAKPPEINKLKKPPVKLKKPTKKAGNKSSD
jgi:tRNA1(Val) A37 N6-methylase TrmN6